MKQVMGIFREPVNRGVNLRIFGTIVNVYEDCSFQTMMDIYIVELGDGSALLETPVGEDHVTPDQVCHSGVPSSLATTAMEMALKTMNHNINPLELTVKHHLGAVKGDTIRAEATVITVEQDTAQVKCTLVNQQEQLVAEAIGLFTITGAFIKNI